MENNKKTFFASDLHLGIQGRLSSIDREKLFVHWLTSIEDEMEALYLVGDIFDYWFEYKEVVPKGFTRIIGKLAELRDSDISIYFFTGNHDMWMFRYFEEELGIPIYRQPIFRQIYGKDFYIGHGDGLGPGDQGYKILKSILANKYCQWTYAMLHPNLGIKLMKFFSGKSRESQGSNDQFLGVENEWLITFVEAQSKTKRFSEIDYYVFGHRHLPLQYNLKSQKSIYYNLGDWLHHQTYLEVGRNGLILKSFGDVSSPIIVLA